MNFNAAPAGRIAPTRVDDYFRESLRRRRSRLCGLFGGLAAIGFREEALGDDTAQRTSGREKTGQRGQARKKNTGQSKRGFARKTRLTQTKRYDVVCSFYRLTPFPGATLTDPILHFLQLKDTRTTILKDLCKMIDERNRNLVVSR